LPTVTLFPVDISQNPNARMAYTWYEEDIVQQHGVLLEGWTGPAFGNPSELSMSLTSLGKLLNALKSGECAFRKLSAAEATERKTKWDADVAAGRMTPKRSDAGVPRNEGDKENGPGSAGGDDDDANVSSDRDEPPPPKRQRKNATGTAPAKKSRVQAKPRSKKAATAPRNYAATKAALQRLKTSRQRITSRPTVEDSNEEGSGPSAENALSGALKDAAQPAA
jgi:hypothetical protein